MGLKGRILTLPDLYDPPALHLIEDLSLPGTLRLNPLYGEGTAHLRPIREGLAYCVYNFTYREDVSVSAGGALIPDRIWFYVCLSGNSRFLLQNRSLHIQPGTSDVFTGGYDKDIRQDMRGEVPYKMVSLLLDPAALAGITGMEPETLFRLSMAANRNQPSRVPREMRLAAEILAQGCPTPANARLFTEAKALELIAYQVGMLEKESGRKQKREEKSYVEKIRYAAEILEKNLITPPGIFDLADQAGLNHNKVIQGFKEIYGQTPFEYLSHVRLRKAAERIHSREFNVTEAAFSVGYANLSHFSRIFRRAYGMNPSDFQKARDPAFPLCHGGGPKAV